MESTTVALIGIGVTFGVSILTAILFLIAYTRLKLKDDTNIRRRVIAAVQPEAKAPLIVSQPVEFVEPVIPEPPPPQPIIYPTPVFQPPPPPEPAPRIVVMQPPPQPLPPPPPREPEVVVHEIIHRYEPHPPQIPPPEPRVVRRQSWAGPLEDDWVLVKRITKGKARGRYDSSDESSDEEETRGRRRQRKRLDRYDLATGMVPVGIQPQMMGRVMMAQPANMIAAAPVMAQPMLAATQPTYMPFLSMPR